MKHKLALSIMILLAVAAGQSSAAPTDVSIVGPPQVTGTGPWTVKFTAGALTLDTGCMYNGLMFVIIDANNNTIPGFTDTPKGDPTPGGPGVPWTGTANTMVRGNYTAKVTMSYVDALGKMQTVSAQQAFTVP